MKNLLFLLFLFTIQNGFSQNFFRVGGSIFSEEKFNSFFKNIKKENYPNPVRFYVFETIKKNVSLTKKVVVPQEEELGKNNRSRSCRSRTCKTIFKRMEIHTVFYSKPILHDV